MAISEVRKNIINECEWGVAHNATIHYSQDLTLRDESLSQWNHHTTPLSTDCSGALTDIFHAAGAPDPSGYNYNAIGNTGTLYSNSEHIAMSACEPGDFIVCFNGAESEHCYVVTKKLAGGDYQIFTHGDENTPAYERLSAVSSYWNSIGRMVACRTLPVHDTYTWTVLTGNKVLAHTDHPVRWAIRHPRSFRRHGWIRYRRDIA